ncbi:hypothetical protein GGS26DRAFT_592674 [Hypomontagnella submonticulosa]|nr:hypothetical protein GGS26DRAFT_592674 [Hypomontagnella submonticulosa]
MDQETGVLYPKSHNKDFKPKNNNAVELSRKILTRSPFYEVSRDLVLELWPTLPEENLDYKHLEILFKYLDTALFHGLLLGSHGRLAKLEVDIFAPIRFDHYAATISDPYDPPLVTIWLCGSLDRDFRPSLRLTKLAQLRLLIHEMCHAYIECYWQQQDGDIHAIEGNNGEHGYIFWRIFNRALAHVRSWGPDFGDIVTARPEPFEI